MQGGRSKKRNSNRRKGTSWRSGYRCPEGGHWLCKFPIGEIATSSVLACIRKEGRKGTMERLDVNKLREEFNRASEFVRIVTFLSPT